MTLDSARDWISMSSLSQELLYGLVQIFLKQFLYSAIQFFFATDIFLISYMLFCVEKRSKIISMVVPFVNVYDTNIADFNSFTFAMFAEGK